MEQTDSTKSINKPLQQFRFKIYQQRKFLKKFYTPFWLQPITKTGLTATLLIWLLAVIILVLHKKDFTANNFYFLLLSAAIVMAAHCIAYLKYKRKRGRLSNQHL